MTEGKLMVLERSHSDINAKQKSNQNQEKGDPCHETQRRQAEMNEKLVKNNFGVIEKITETPARRLRMRFSKGSSLHQDKKGAKSAPLGPPSSGA